jgi:hypothetical protein
MFSIHKTTRVDASKATTVAIVFAFTILIINCLFLDKGYYESIPIDLFTHLDGLYRVSLGQIPHRDFSTSIGIFNFLLASLFLTAGADHLQSIQYYNAVLLLGSLGIVLYLHQTRLDNIVALFFGILIASVLACKLMIGDGNFTDSTDAMFYNRIGYAALTLQVAFYIPSTNAASKVRAIVDGCLIGLLCGLLFYTKIPFGVVSLFLIGLNLLNGSLAQKWSLTIVSIAVFLAVFVFVEAVLGVRLWWLRDMHMAAISSQGQVTWRTPVHKVLLCLPELILSVIAPLAISRWVYGRVPRYWMLLGAYLTIASVGLVMSSTTGQELFLPISFLVFCCGTMVKKLDRGHFIDRKNATVSYKVVLYGVYIWGLISISYPLFYNVVYSSLMYVATTGLNSENSLLASIHSKAPSTQADGGGAAGRGSTPIDKLDGLSNFDAFMLGRVSKRPLVYDEVSFPEFTVAVNDGLHAAKTGCPARSRISTFDTVNIFPVLLNWPEGGGMLHVHPNHLVSGKAHLTAEEMYGKVDCILEPKLEVSGGGRDFLRELYGEYVSRNFTRSFESKFWAVWTRTDSRAGMRK